MVLHTLPEGKLKQCLEKFAQADLPNLWKPRPDQFFQVEKIPNLGSGKLDLRKIRELAMSFRAQPTRESPLARNVLQTRVSAAAPRACSAGLEPAVSPICNRQRVGNTDMF